jgi:lipid-binding SYLF domain-containing protein
MRIPFALYAGLAALLTLISPRSAQADPETTVRVADQVLHEAMSTAGRQIPAALLADAQGIAVIPGVIKIGFIAGLRRGHGVVMVRDPNGAWSLPQFVTLTGGSVGWQAGVQGTDVLLVFMTHKSVEGLLNGKFTIGADVAAAAGPVGRNAAAATDARLKAEILSYSRSRGLFAGLSLDGSAIEIDSVAHSSYYGSGPGQAPAQIPESAAKLLADVSAMTGSAEVHEVSPADGPQLAAPAEANGPHLAAAPALSPRDALAQSASELHSMVDDGWRRYLALPREVFEGQNPPSVDSLHQALRQYDRVAADPKYKALADRREFRSTHRLLGEYARSLSDGSSRQLALPPPPRR